MFKRLAMVTMAKTMLASVPAYEGQWMQDSDGWWWQNEDGSYPAWHWAWIDGNEERVKNGREPLTANEELMEIAVVRAEEPDYCEPHRRPDGSSAATAVSSSDYVGENLANMTYGYRNLDKTAQDAVNGWMNSTAHKKNILNSRYKQTGAGVYIEGSKMCVIQLFTD